MAFAFVPDLPASVPPPGVVAPAPREVSFGRVTGTVSRVTRRVVVLVDGKEAGEQEVEGARYDLAVSLPPRNVRVRIVAEDGFGNRAETAVGPVFGLPREAAPSTARSYEDPVLAREVRALVEAFPGTSGIYVENLRTGAGAAWNARARFPAASTLKIGIAIEVLRRLDARPPPGSSLDRLLELMLVHSDNAASNELLAWIGGSETAGAAELNETMGALGLNDSYMYGGFLAAAPAKPPIPLAVESQPTFEGKYTTAWDLAQLHRYVHLATAGRGPLVERLGGSFTAADARFLLYVLADSADRGKLDRFLGGDAVVMHKAGWVADARHDSGLVYSRDGVFVASVMTWNSFGAGEPSDVLAGEVARRSLERFAADGQGRDLVKDLVFRL